MVKTIAAVGETAISTIRPFKKIIELSHFLIETQMRRSKIV